jgi:hypothetical protein
MQVIRARGDDARTIVCGEIVALVTQFVSPTLTHNCATSDDGNSLEDGQSKLIGFDGLRRSRRLKSIIECTESAQPIPDPFTHGTTRLINHHAQTTSHAGPSCCFRNLRDLRTIRILRLHFRPSTPAENSPGSTDIYQTSTASAATILRPAAGAIRNRETTVTVAIYPSKWRPCSPD